jgi:protein phosphatase 1 regulatory subunit 11
MEASKSARLADHLWFFSLIIYLTVCCIYHRNRAIGESSSESESDSSESSSSDTDSDRGVKDKKHNAHHCHQDSRQHDGRNIPEHGGPTIPRDESSHIKSQAKKRTPNAYERIPKHRRHPSKEPKPETV